MSWGHDQAARNQKTCANGISAHEVEFDESNIVVGASLVLFRFEWWSRRCSAEVCLVPAEKVLELHDAIHNNFIECSIKYNKT